MRLLLILATLMVITSCDRGVEEARTEPIRVLFVGNSLTYVGKLPAVLDAMSEANGRVTRSNMIVTGGATLTDRVNDGSVAAALAAGKYSYVVLQERGGDFTCSFGPEVCVNARASLITLSDLARRHRVVPILLGTYQGYPPASRNIVEAESGAAQEAGADYISVSERLQELRSALPDMKWFAADGMHPGTDLTLLDALLLYERIHGANPSHAAFSVSAPIYTSMSLLYPELRSAGSPFDQPDLPSSSRYESDQIAALMERLW